MLPPMVVYKSVTISVYGLWMEGGPDGTTYAASKNGWVDMKKLCQWFGGLEREGFVVLTGTVLLWYLSAVGTFPDKAIKEIEKYFNLPTGSKFFLG